MLTLKHTEKIEAFSSPINVFDIPYEALFRDQLINECMKWKAETKSIVDETYMFSSVGWQSQKVLFKTKEPCLGLITQSIIKGVFTSAKSIAKSIDLEKYSINAEGWINVNERGTLHKPHIHANSSFSGVFYVKVPKAESSNGVANEIVHKDPAGSIEFLDPRNSLRAYSKGIEELGSSLAFTDRITMPPREGRLIVFPAWLKHWVYPVEVNDDRISISFNTWFVRED